MIQSEPPGQSVLEGAARGRCGRTQAVVPLPLVLCSVSHSHTHDPRLACSSTFPSPTVPQRLNRIKLDRDPAPPPRPPWCAFATRPVVTSCRCRRWVPTTGLEETGSDETHWSPSCVASGVVLFLLFCLSVCLFSKTAVSEHCCSTLLFPLDAKRCWSGWRTGTVALDWFTVLDRDSSSPTVLAVYRSCRCQIESEGSRVLVGGMCFVGFEFVSFFSFLPSECVDYCGSVLHSLGQ